MNMGTLSRLLTKVTTILKENNDLQYKHEPEDKYPLDTYPHPPPLKGITSYPLDEDYPVLEFSQEEDCIAEVWPVNGRLEVKMYENRFGEKMRFDLEDLLAALEHAKSSFPDMEKKDSSE